MDSKRLQLIERYLDQSERSKELHETEDVVKAQSALIKILENIIELDNKMMN